VERLPIFIYGTLCSGERNAGLIARALAAQQPATFAGTLRVMLNDGYPYPCLQAGSGPVVGSLVTLHEALYDEALARLDRLEDYLPESDRGLYLRRIVEVNAKDGPAKAWTYLWNGPPPNGPLLEDGDFCRWNRARNARETA